MTPRWAVAHSTWKAAESSLQSRSLLSLEGPLHLTLIRNFGTAGMGGLNLELAKNFRVMAYGIYGTGTARYFNGLGPQYVVAPIATGPGAFTIDTSMVHAGTAYTGVE